MNGSAFPKKIEAENIKDIKVSWTEKIDFNILGNVNVPYLACGAFLNNERIYNFNLRSNKNSRGENLLFTGFLLFVSSGVQYFR